MEELTPPSAVPLRVRRSLSLLLGAAVAGVCIACLEAQGAEEPKRPVVPNFYLPERNAMEARKSLPKPIKLEADEAAKSKPAQKPRQQAQNRSSKTQKQQAKTAKPAPSKAQRRFPTPPSDVYQLASYFKERWDATHFIVTPEERQRYLSDSLSEKLKALDKLFGAVTEAIEKREANLRNTARAVYLLDYANTAPVYAREDHTIYHLLALRATMRSDARQRAQALAAYEPLRNTLNEAAQKLSSSPQDTPTTSLPEGGEKGRFSITQSVGESVVRENERLLAERSFSVETLKATLVVEAFLRGQEHRLTLASLAPPPPGPEIAYKPLVPVDTPMPVETGVKPRTLPDLPKVKPPKANALDVETSAGATIQAALDGRVAFAGKLRGVGEVVIVEHDGGYFSIYGGLSKLLVEHQQQLKARQALGYAGVLEGRGVPGVRFEVRKQEKSVAPSELLKGADVRSLILKP